MSEPVGKPRAAAELRQYGLETLAAHLYAAGRIDQLLRLFESDRWISMRRGGGDATLLGLRSDIDLAWQALQEPGQEADEETMTGSPSQFVHEVRLGAVRSSLTTLSLIPTTLVVRAIQTGLWSVEHVLAVTSDHPPVQQLEVCAELLDLPDLDGHERRRVQRVSRDIVVRSGEELSVRVLVALCRRMDPGIYAETVRACLQSRAESVHIDVGTARRVLGWERDPTENRIEAEEVIDVLAALSPGQRATLLARTTDAVLTALRPQAHSARSADDPEPASPAALVGLFEDALRSLAADSKADLSLAEWLLRNLAPYLDEHPDLSGFGADLAELLTGGSAPGLARAAVEATAGRLDRDTLTRLTRLTDPGLEPADRSGPGHLLAALIQSQRRKMHRPRRPWRPSTDLESIDVHLDDARERLAAMVLASIDLASPGLDHPELTTNARQDEAIQRIALFAVLPLFVERMSAEELSSIVHTAFTPQLLLAQYDIVDGIDGVAADLSPEGVSARRLVRGELLCAALKHAADQAEPLVDAWRAVPSAQISSADLAPVLAYLRTLPLESTRHQLVTTMFTEHYDEGNPSLRLQALRLVAPYLSGSDCEQLFAEIGEHADPQLRLDALVLLAARFDSDALADTLSALPRFADALQQSWVLGALTPDSEDLRHQVTGWRLAAISDISGGARMGEALVELATDGGEAAAWRSDLVYEALTSASPNRRLDALVSLGSGLEQELDERTARLVLELPAVDDAGRYSWRAIGITALAARLPAAVVPDAWSAARELPTRMRIGNSESFGWHWSYEFARAAATYALVPQLPEAMLWVALRDAQELSWTPRRAVLTALAEHADTELAGAVLESVLDRATQYAALPDPGPSHLVEGVEVLEPIAMFKVRREVDTAELIAALAPKLDQAHLTQAVRHLPAFTNDGPRAWLPGQLVPYLDGALRAQVLPQAVTSAMAFVTEDPTRLDMLTFLLPHLREMLDKDVAPIRHLVHRYFPGRRDLLLDAPEREAMTLSDRAAYEELMDVYRPDEALGSTAPADVYAFVESIVRNPLFNGSIEIVVAQTLLRVPLQSRIDAMPQIAEFLPDDLLRQVVDGTATEILEANEELETTIERVVGLLPFLTPEQHQRMLQMARAMPTPKPVDLVAVGGTVYHAIARELSLMVPASRSAEPTSPGIQMRDRNFWTGELVSEIRNLAGPRSWLILALAREGSESIRHDAYDALLSCSDAELVHAIPAVMPAEEPGLRSRLIARILELPAGFARGWVLWQVADELTPDEVEAVEPAAHEAARAILDPLGRAVAWLTLANLRTGVGRTGYLRDALAAAAEIEGTGDLVKALSGIVVTANGDTAVLEPALAMVLDRSPGPDRARAVTLVADAHPDIRSLPDPLPTQLGEACCLELRRTAAEGRAEFLTALANLPRQWLREMPDRHRFEAARAVQEVCTTYRWF
jgi:hypothetical protein